MQHIHTGAMNQITSPYQYFLANFTDSIILHIFKSKAPIFEFNVNLFLLQRDGFYHAKNNNFTF